MTEHKKQLAQAVTIACWLMIVAAVWLSGLAFLAFGRV
jgi:hypothetical protein